MMQTDLENFTDVSEYDPNCEGSWAVLSGCKTFRYLLGRSTNAVDAYRNALVIGVNPSTADHMIDDQSVKKITGLVERANCSSFVLANLFAYRATDVRELRQCVDPCGPNNFQHLSRAMALADIVIVAWGASGKLPKALRDEWRKFYGLAIEADVPLWCWTRCADGHPKHPLMLSYDTPLLPWAAPS